MTAGTARLARAPPPSPPQSPSGYAGSEASQEPSGMYHSTYGSQGSCGGPGQANNISFGSQSSLSMTMQYGPTSEYSQNVSLHPMLPNGLQVSTPPADEPGTLGPSTTHWGSPSRRATFPKDRVQKSPRQRRRAKKGKDREPRATLPGPLSEITKHMTDIPLKDMEEHVHRSIEKRHMEVAEKGGKVARPMNSFMLYRSAYQERTKQWFAQNNHQVVSEVTGDSWARESTEVKAKYIRLASIEKQNHLRAHPGYKFTPAKDKKKRSGSEDRSFHDYRGTPCRSTPGRSTPGMDSNGWDSSRSTPFDTMDHGLPANGCFPSSWPTSNPSRSSFSGAMLTSEPSQYVQPTANPALLAYNVEDVHARMDKVDLDEMQYPSTTLSGLPGAAHHDLLQPQTQLTGQLDPQLLEYSGAPSNQETGQLYGNSHYTLWQESPGQNSYIPVATEPSPASFVGAQSSQPGMDGRWAWVSSQGNSFDTAGNDFDSLFTDSNGY
ncbi:hypothetical protein BJY01DRAFT_243941 [Aspergillus pseudoustus]|uniref:HMG box domain-containing protein n=1 Tax=Aspergillus pseudoustus TaxID=1810923 RepID=A0ABR4KNA0_9EURO